jgi:hypothetical protein
VEKNAGVSDVSLTAEAWPASTRVPPVYFTRTGAVALTTGMVGGISATRVVMMLLHSEAWSMEESKRWSSLMGWEDREAVGAPDGGGLDGGRRCGRPGWRGCRT